MSQNTESYTGDEREEDGSSQEDEYSDAEYNQGDESETENNHAQNLKWCLGFNYALYDGAHNLTDDNRKEIFYVAGHTGVIYDYENRTQRLLQGHCNKITCCTYCPDRRIIITADKGPNALLVVWDVITGTPQKTIFDPHPNGVECLDITSDGQLIATLSREVAPVYSQTVSIWKWEDSDKNPCYATGVLNSSNNNSNPDNPIDYQKFVRFNHLKKNEFVTTGSKSVRFWNTNEQGGTCSSYSPHDPKKEHNNSKEFTQTVFIPKTTQAVTGTMDGHLVVWDISLIMEDYSQPDHRREIKTINLLNTSQKKDAKANAITILKAHKELIIIGSSNGSVRFYDFQFRIVSWFEDFELSQITSISLSNEFFDYEITNKIAKENEYDFRYPDFIVVDSNAKVVLLKTELFQEVEKEKKKGNVLVESIIKPIVSISARPNSSILGIACTNGHVYQWNFLTKDAILQSLKNFGQDVPNCIQYSPDGKYLVVAGVQGNIYVYNVEKRSWQQTILLIAHKKKGIKANYITFSENSVSFAIMDDHCCVSLYKLGHRFDDVSNPIEWVFSGKLRAHCSSVTGVCFGESLKDGGEKRHRLFSTGEDMYLMEYNVERSNFENLVVSSYNQIEQECIPTACLWYPVNYLNEDVIMIATSDYKIKLFNVKDRDNKICKQTLLGPSYGGPINKLIYLNIHNKTEDDVPKYVAYSTKEKIIGIIKLPQDGNPNKTMGLIAHPEKISSITTSSDGKFIFTSGETDLTVNMWTVNFVALEENIAMNTTSDNPLDIYPNQLEGGKEGQIYKDLKNFFYYSQIRAKKENTTKARILDGKIPIDEIPNLMCALGYYPTQLEIKNMQDEIKYSRIHKGEYVTELILDTFVKLFINHRPVYGLTKQYIRGRLDLLTNSENEDSLTRDEFLELLQKRGEKMDLDDIKRCFKHLIDDGPFETSLPDRIGADYLINTILGFKESDEEDDYEENMETMD